MYPFLHQLLKFAYIILVSKFVCYSARRDISASGLQIYGGPRSLSHDFKIWPITFQGSGPSGSILFLSYSESRNSTKQKAGSQYSKTCLKQPLKKDITKILVTNGRLMKVKSIAECSAILLTCIK